jgi:NAD+ synthetase
VKIRNEHETLELRPELAEALSRTRVARAFDPLLYRDVKTRLINDYMERFGLSACVVAVSGGVDSAVVLGLVAEAARRAGSPIKRIVALCLPVTGTDGVTGQSEATARGEEVCRAFGVAPTHLDLGRAHAALVTDVDAALSIRGQAWAVGQVASYLRTAAIYYVTSLLTQDGFRPVFIGTTNRDEGGYLGYFGKASDGMVDVQMISDIHKSEVYGVARLLGVPQSVLDAAPTGDMFDASIDEEVFGAPYDFVELYQAFLSWPEAVKEQFVSALDEAAKSQWNGFAANVEKMHNYNGHKYLGRSPAVHLDALEAAVPGGWNNAPRSRFPKPAGRFVNPVVLPSAFETQASLASNAVAASPFPALGEAGRSFPGLLSGAECSALVGFLDTRDWVPVGRDGYLAGFDPDTAPIGSWRLSAYSESLADSLWRRIRASLAPIRVMDASTPADHGGHPLWRPIGVNPLLRFIKYEPGNLLVPHYDAPYVWNEHRRTLVTLVCYLDDMPDGEGGCTRFIADPQDGVPVADRDLADWLAPARPDQVLFQLRPQAGLGMCWDHRVLHDSSVVVGAKPKYLLRTDVVYERLDWYRSEADVPGA